MSTVDQITFGPVHLEVTDPARTARFWETRFGFDREGERDGIAIRSAGETLIVLHGGATAPFRQGHSGLYHLAIHVPDERDFARIVKRFSDLDQPCSPTDHTFSKALYLTDPDGITVEVTLETPERFAGVKPGPGRRLLFVGADGIERPGSVPLDLEDVFKAYEEGSEHQPAAKGTRIGHIHLYVGNLETARDFYVDLGFELARWWPPMQVADFGAGGPFKHRIAINTWQGLGAPPAPAGTARMRHFEIRYASEDQLATVLAAQACAVADDGAIELTDPSGTRIRPVAEARRRP